MSHGDDWDLLLAEYIDGTLTPRQRQKVEEHLSGCPSCRENITAARAALGLQESVTPAAVPPIGSFLAAVERRAERSAPAADFTPERRPHPLSILAERGQAEPLLWFLLAMPVLVALVSPGLQTVGLAAASLALGSVLEYFLLTREAVTRDYD